MGGAGFQQRRRVETPPTPASSDTGARVKNLEELLEPGKQSHQVWTPERGPVQRLAAATPPQVSNVCATRCRRYSRL